MAINRRLIKYVVAIVAVLVVAGLALLTLAWMSPLTVPIMAYEDLSITDVQFDEGYLAITVKNLSTYATTISEVMVNQTSTPHTVPVCEPISADGQVSIEISFRWVSGYTYRVRLMTARGNCFFHNAVAP
jgi:hypothetical protein